MAVGFIGTVGFIGLGVMGRPMAANLLAAGFDLVVYNRTPTSVPGAVGAGSPAEVAAGADIIITMLADDEAVRSVVGGGLLPVARPGTLIIDMSTVSPALSRSLAAEAAGRGVRLLDAPVSGGDAGARDGTLSIMVGGDPADLERARPVLEVLGGSIVHCGPAGAGQVVKACNQVLVAVTIAGISEALVLGASLGVEPGIILDVLSRGLAANRVMELRRDNFLRHTFTPGFRVDLHHKDLAIALSNGVPLPLTSGVQQLFRQLRADGRGGDDHTAVLAAVEALAAAHSAHSAHSAEGSHG